MAPAYQQTHARARIPAVGPLVAGALAAFLLSGGCAPYPLRGEPPKVATMTIEVPTTDALVLPEPGGPTVLSVIETRYLNALEQEIVLGTRSAAPGQNSFHVVFFGPVEGRTGWENIRNDDMLRDEVLETEMEERFPGIVMRTSGYFVQNRYGPFGYAIGRAGANDLCIYGWQRIQSQVPMMAFMRDRGVMAVRLRLCRTGATEQQLLRVMYRYSINGYFLPRSWQPYGRPMGEPEGIGRIGGPLSYPNGAMGPATVLDGAMGPEPVEPAAPRRPVSKDTPVAAEQEVPLTPLVGYPTVPTPATAPPQAPRGNAPPTSSSSAPAPVPTPSATQVN